MIDFLMYLWYDGAPMFAWAMMLITPVIIVYSYLTD